MSTNLPTPRDAFAKLQGAARPALKTWMNDRYIWLTTMLILPRLAALGLDADAGDPAYLREFALAVHSGDALTYAELIGALTHAGITSDSTRKALVRALRDPRAGGSELYDVDAVAKWVQENRTKTRASAKARKESGVPVRSAKLIEEALAWAKYADDGRHPSIASILFDLQAARNKHAELSRSRFGYEREQAKNYLTNAKWAETLIVQRYQTAKEAGRQAEQERAARRAPQVEAPVVKVTPPPRRCEYTTPRWHGETCKRRATVGFTGHHSGDHWYCTQHAKLNDPANLLSEQPGATSDDLTQIPYAWALAHKKPHPKLPINTRIADAITHTDGSEIGNNAIWYAYRALFDALGPVKRQRLAEQITARVRRGIAWAYTRAPQVEAPGVMQRSERDALIEELLALGETARALIDGERLRYKVVPIKGLLPDETTRKTSQTNTELRAWIAELGAEIDKYKRSRGDTDAPRMYRYGALNRPIGFATVPRGYVDVEPPVEGQPRTRHGVVVYDRPLTPDETKSYELYPYITPDALVEKLYADIAQYGKEYATLLREDGIQWFQLDREHDMPNVYTDVPFSEIVRRVADRLLAAYPASS